MLHCSNALGWVSFSVTFCFIGAFMCETESDLFFPTIRNKSCKHTQAEHSYYATTSDRRRLKIIQSTSPSPTGQWEARCVLVWLKCQLIIKSMLLLVSMWETKCFHLCILFVYYWCSVTFRNLLCWRLWDRWWRCLPTLYPRVLIASLHLVYGP